jgi:hypothetical protein
VTAVDRLVPGRTPLSAAAAKALVGACLARAAGNPAALTAADTALAAAGLAIGGPAKAGSAKVDGPIHRLSGPVTADYQTLLDRWLPDADEGRSGLSSSNE